MIDLECAGLQAILIDWQGGFLGSVANDLMWALFPFLEANAQDKVIIRRRFEIGFLLKQNTDGF